MHFTLVDRVLEATDRSAVSLKQVSRAEEYLQDHFPTFPVLPGVMMLEAMIQTARIVTDRLDEATPMVLGQVRTLRYNRFVTPGASIRTEVTMMGEPGECGEIQFKGRVHLLEPGAPAEGEIAAAGRFVMRPVRIAAQSIPC